MLFQDVTPDTSGYMVAGYTIFFVLLAIYLLSLSIRARNLRQDLALLETLQKENKPKAPPRAKPAGPAAGKKAASTKKR